MLSKIWDCFFGFRQRWFSCSAGKSLKLFTWSFCSSVFLLHALKLSTRLFFIHFQCLCWKRNLLSSCWKRLFLHEYFVFKLLSRSENSQSWWYHENSIQNFDNGYSLRTICLRIRDRLLHYFCIYQTWKSICKGNNRCHNANGNSHTCGCLYKFKESFILAYFVYGATIIVDRVMRAEVKNLWLFIGLSVLHGLINVVGKETEKLRYMDSLISRL